MRLKLYYPSKPFRITQRFGDSNACVQSNSNLPVSRRRVVSKQNGVCPVGFQELYPLLGMRGHTGTDLFAPRGTILRAPCNGIVEELCLEPERGLGVGIVTSEKFYIGEQEHYAKVRQWHLKAIWVRLGQRVKIGDPIGEADSTGLSSGDHNHFELKPVEKRPNGIYYNVLQDNGYFGSVDPVPYFTGEYAIDIALDPISRAIARVREWILILASRR